MASSEKLFDLLNEYPNLNFSIISSENSLSLKYDSPIDLPSSDFIKLF